MDLDALKLQLNAAETRIDTLNAYSEDARKQGNALLMHQISQDLREVEGEAKRLRAEIARFHTPIVWL